MWWCLQISAPRENLPAAVRLCMQSVWEGGTLLSNGGSSLQPNNNNHHHLVASCQPPAVAAAGPHLQQLPTAQLQSAVQQLMQPLLQSYALNLAANLPAPAVHPSHLLSLLNMTAANVRSPAPFLAAS